MGVLNNRDEIVQLALSGGSWVVPLASFIAVVIPPLAIVVVVAALWKAAAILLLLVYSSLHHDAEPLDSLGSIAAKVFEESLCDIQVLGIKTH
jgi:hypothetical protein